MTRYVTRGIVSHVEQFHELLSFVHLNSIDDEAERLRVPFYGRIGDEYLGRCVDMIYEYVGKSLRASIRAFDFGACIQLPNSMVKEIMQDYTLTHFPHR